MKKIRKAVIPAAGFGTRFLPATKAMPKDMLPIVDKPTIQYIGEEILESGINEILIISGHAKAAKIARWRSRELSQMGGDHEKIASHEWLDYRRPGRHVGRRRLRAG